MSLISVIMPIYNADSYLENSIKSILAQSYSKFELILINDGSYDKSEEIINSFKDKRIKYLKNEKNKGIVYSLNKGIEISKGEYIARMDSDDIALYNRFEEQINFLKKNLDIDICGTNFYRFGSNLKLKKIKLEEKNKEIMSNLLFNSPLCHPSIMMRKKIFENGKKYDENFPGMEDYKLWIDLACNHKFYNLQVPLLKYRIVNTSITRIEEKKRKQRLNLLRKLAIEVYKKMSINYKDIYFLFQFPDSCCYLKLDVDKNPNNNIELFLKSFEKDYLLNKDYLDVNSVKKYLGRNYIKYILHNFNALEKRKLLNKNSIKLTLYGIRYFINRKVNK